jgi:hypothetical protein
LRTAFILLSLGFKTQEPDWLAKNESAQRGYLPCELPTGCDGHLNLPLDLFRVGSANIVTGSSGVPQTSAELAGRLARLPATAKLP